MKKFFGISVVILIFLGGFVFYQFAKFNDSRLHIIFCDVGQGDGIFIRTASNKNFLIDAGSDEKIIGCLERHLPFWERNISVAFLSHPHLDHFAGFNYVVKRYNLISFATEDLNNKSASFQGLLSQIKDKGLKVQYLLAGDSFKTKDGARFLVLGPTKDYIQKTSPNGQIGESKESASLVILLSYGSFTSIFTGDSQATGLSEAISGSIQNIKIFGVPHHGSKTGLNSEILNKLKPSYAIISVGKNNKYGHPNAFTLDLLNKFNIKILRTDKNGDIEIISDGKSFKIR
ncbi:MAG: hypothetical protein A3B44_01245 [Candidatus Levybacteria bacterium RIFCSPLOWO2_01_FULL_38_21]|nr:MAG: hypothetical protein A3B44_01245 [Candidatus Levybacteria bacterium RIFCSPLOWO2_01_FULL_38_21]